jgi:hypothetical protein
VRDIWGPTRPRWLELELHEALFPAVAQVPHLQTLDQGQPGSLSSPVLTPGSQVWFKAAWRPFRLAVVCSKDDIIDIHLGRGSAANLDVLRAHHLHARQDRRSDAAQIPLRRPGPRSLPAGELSSLPQVPGLYPVLLATPTTAKFVRPHKYCSGTQT